MTKGCAAFLRGGSPGASHQLLQRSLGGSGDFRLTAYERTILKYLEPLLCSFLENVLLFLLFLFHLDSLWAFCTWTTRYDRPKKFPDGPSNAQDAKGDAEFAATIHSNLAAAYAKKGDHDKALAAAEEAWFDWPWAKCFGGLEHLSFDHWGRDGLYNYCGDVGLRLWISWNISVPAEAFKDL